MMKVHVFNLLLVGFLLAGCSVNVKWAEEGADDYPLPDNQENDQNSGSPVAGPRLPVANAGADLEVLVGERVTLDGRRSYDPDGDPLVFLWTQDRSRAAPMPEVALSNPAAATPRFVAPTVPGELSFTITVSDGEHHAFDQVRVLVVEEHDLPAPPTAEAGPDLWVHPGELVRLTATSTMATGEVHYRWSQVQGVDVELSPLAEGVVELLAPDLPTSLLLKLEATDGTLHSAPDYVAIQVGPSLDAAPTASLQVEFDEDNVFPGDRVVLRSLVDTAGACHFIRWFQSWGPQVELAAQDEASVHFTAPDNVGTVEICAEMTLCGGASLEEPVWSTGNYCKAIPVATIDGGEPPVAHAGPDQELDLESDVFLDGTASHDPDGSGLSYRWIQTGGPIVELTDADTPTPVFPTPEEPAIITFMLVVDDGTSASLPDTVIIRIGQEEPPAADD